MTQTVNIPVIGEVRDEKVYFYRLTEKGEKLLEELDKPKQLPLEFKKKKK